MSKHHLSSHIISIRSTTNILGLPLIGRISLLFFNNVIDSEAAYKLTDDVFLIQNPHNLHNL